MDKPRGSSLDDVGPGGTRGVARWSAGPWRSTAEIGQRLRELRVGDALSQREVGRRLRRSHCLVSRWESGQREPTLLDLIQLSLLYRVSTDALLASSVPESRSRRWSSRAYSATERARVGQALRHHRLVLGISIRELRSLAGVSGWRLISIEGGADPSLNELRRIRAALGLDLDRLLDGRRLDKNGAPPTLWRQPVPSSSRTVQHPLDASASCRTSAEALELGYLDDR